VPRKPIAIIDLEALWVAKCGGLKDLTPKDIQTNDLPAENQPIFGMRMLNSPNKWVTAKDFLLKDFRRCIVVASMPEGISISIVASGAQLSDTHGHVFCMGAAWRFISGRGLRF
jgi:hypothetical protein